MTIEIVRIDEHNRALLDNLDEEIFDEAVDPGCLAVYVKEQSHLMLVAILEGTVIGQVLAVVHRQPDRATELYIDNLAVSEKFQRLGIATKLLTKLFAIGKKNGCDEVWVAVDPDNEQAKKFYRSMNLSVSTALIFEGKIE